MLIYSCLVFTESCYSINVYLPVIIWNEMVRIAADVILLTIILLFSSETQSKSYCILNTRN